MVYLEIGHRTPGERVTCPDDDLAGEIIDGQWRSRARTGPLLRVWRSEARTGRRKIGVSPDLTQDLSVTTSRKRGPDKVGAGHRDAAQSGPAARAPSGERATG